VVRVSADVTLPSETDLVNLANSDPSAALDAIEPLLQSISCPSDLDASLCSDETASLVGASTLLRTRAIALQVLGDLLGAEAAMARASICADRAGHRRMIGLSLMTSAPIQANLGRTDRALEEIDGAISLLSGNDLAEARFQRGSMRLVLADFSGALEDFRLAVRRFRVAGIDSWVADTLMNRGSTEIFVGRPGSARRSLTAASSRYSELGDRVGEATCSFNLALASHIAGEPIRALAEFDRAARQWLAAEDNYPVDFYRAEPCEALLAVGRFSDAALVSVRSIATLDAAGHRLRAVRQRLVAARALLRSGEVDSASRLAVNARDELRRQRQMVRAAQAEALCCEIELESSAAGPALVARIDGAVHALADAGATEWLHAAELVRARVFRAASDLDSARRTIARQIKVDQAPDRIIQLYLLRAELESEAGDGRSALRACRSALDHLHGLLALAPAIEVRASLSHHIDGIRQIALRQLMQSGRVRAALEFHEASEVPAAQPAAAAMGVDLAKRRALAVALRAAEFDGRDVLGLQHEVRALDMQIWKSALASNQRNVDGRPGTMLESARPVSTIVGVEDDLWRLDLRSGRASARVPPVSVRDASADASMLQATLTRAWTRANSALVATEVAGLGDAIDVHLGSVGSQFPAEQTLAVCCHLDATVLSNHMPSLRRRRWVRSLSAASGSRTRLRSSGHTLFVSGPDLPAAQKEVERLAAASPNSVLLKRSDGTIDRVLEAMNGAAVVHIAAHAVVDAESPVFSFMELSDGPLYLHDFDRIQRPPSVVVLATCDSSIAQTVGAMRIGMTEVLLGIGVRVVVGSICDLPDDDDTIAVVERLHAGPLTSDPAGALHAVVNDDTLTTRQALIARSLVASVASPNVGPAR